MSITLINNTRRMKVFTLAHRWYCAVLGTCACTVIPGKEVRRIAASLTLCAGAVAENLPEAVLKVPEIEAAVLRGALTVRRARPRRNAGDGAETTKTAKTSKRSKK